MKIRVNWIDNTKAISIFLVVLDHFSGLMFEVKSFIYAFHLPVFLLVSGFLITNKLNDFSFSDFFKKQLLSLIKLYLLFSMLSIVIFIAISLAGNKPFDFISLAYAMLYGVHGVDKLLGHGNGALWYFPFFISSLFFYYLLIKLPKLIALIGGVFLVSFSMIYEGPRLPWGIDIAGVGVFFLFVGNLLKLNYANFLPFFKSKKSLFFLPVIIIILFYLTILNGPSNINRVMFGDSVFLYFFNALIGSGIVITLAHQIKENKLMTLFSTHSLVIFSIHLYLVKSARIVTSIEYPFFKILVITLLSFLITFICVKVSQILMPFLNKYLLNKKQ